MKWVRFAVPRMCVHTCVSPVCYLPLCLRQRLNTEQLLWESRNWNADVLIFTTRLFLLYYLLLSNTWSGTLSSFRHHKTHYVSFLSPNKIRNPSRPQSTAQAGSVTQWDYWPVSVWEDVEESEPSVWRLSHVVCPSVSRYLWLMSWDVTIEQQIPLQFMALGT